MYDGLGDGSALDRAETPKRSLSTLGCPTSARVESMQMKRPTISLVLPASTTLETVRPIDPVERSSRISKKDEHIALPMTGDSCLCWTMRNIIYLLYVTLLACLIGVFIFTLVSYAFDNYWLERSLVSNSSWWWTYANDTDFPEDNSDLFSTTETMNYGDQY